MLGSVCPDASSNWRAATVSAMDTSRSMLMGPPPELLLMSQMLLQDLWVGDRVSSTSVGLRVDSDLRCRQNEKFYAGL